MQLRSFILLTILFLTSGLFVSAQETEEKKDGEVKEAVQPKVDLTKNATAEGVAESSIIIYGGLGGRFNLDQIRKTTFERGKISFTNPDGTVDNSTYERWIIRGETLDKEKNRFEQTFPSTKFIMIYDGEKTFGIFNNTTFIPTDSALKSYENQIWHGLEALLRYKENGSKIELGERQKVMGVEFYVLDVTDKQNRKTRFYISVKTLRVMMLEYEDEGVKYRRKFYDYNYAQGTLVPYRTVLWAGDKQIEETDILTITFGQKVEENIFK